MYLLTVGVTRWVGTNTGVGLINWSMLTTWSWVVAYLIFLRLLTPFIRHGLQYAFPYAQPGKIGGSTFSSSLRIKSSWEINLRLERLKRPKRSWRTASLCYLQWTIANKGYSSTVIPLPGGKLKQDSIGANGLYDKSSPLKGIALGSLGFSLTIVCPLCAL